MSVPSVATTTYLRQAAIRNLPHRCTILRAPVTQNASGEDVRGEPAAHLEDVPCRLYARGLPGPDQGEFAPENRAYTLTRWRLSLPYGYDITTIDVVGIVTDATGLEISPGRFEITDIVPFTIIRSAALEQF